MRSDASFKIWFGFQTIKSYVEIWKASNSNTFSHYLKILDFPGCIWIGSRTLRSLKSDPKTPRSLRWHPEPPWGRYQSTKSTPTPPGRLLSSTAGSGTPKFHHWFRNHQSSRRSKFRTPVAFYVFRNLQVCGARFFFDFSDSSAQGSMKSYENHQIRKHVRII